MVYKARPAWRQQWAALLGCGALVAGAAFIAVDALSGELSYGYRAMLVGLSAGAGYLILLVLYRRYSWRYTVDDEKIESRQGIIARSLRSIRVRDLRSVNVHQSIVHRLLRIGDVEFSTAAGGEVEVAFFGVERPLALKQAVQAAQDGLVPTGGD